MVTKFLLRLQYKTTVERRFFWGVMPVRIEEIGLRIKNLREKAKLPQHELARMAGLTQAQISAYELGRSFPGLESTVKLADTLGVTVTALLAETEPRSAAPRPPSKAELAIYIMEAMDFTKPVIDRMRAVLGTLAGYS